MKANSIIVYTAEIAVSSTAEVLISSPLGSCIAVCAFDPVKMTGGMAHVMLPGQPPNPDEPAKNRYAICAVNTLLEEMGKKSSPKEAIAICLVGGANVLKRERDTVHQENHRSLVDIIAKHGNRLCRCATGGTERMTARLDTGSGQLFHTIGDGPETLLFDFMAEHGPNPSEVTAQATASGHDLDDH